MQKNIVDIYLMNVPTLSNNNNKKRADNDKFCYGSKGLSVIFTLNLMIAKYNKTHFIALRGAIRFKFYSIDPFAAKILFLGRKSGEGPSSISFKSLNFFLHSMIPICMFNRHGEFSGLSLRLNCRKETTVVCKKIITSIIRV